MNMLPCLFEGPSGYLKLTIEDYQFPDTHDDEWDSNWLIVAGDAMVDGRRWNFRDPCLTTMELACLAAWLDAVADGQPVRPFCGFTEPNLEFSKTDCRSIRIGFALESAPPWASRGENWYVCGIDLPADASLHTAAANLRQQLARFPQRALANE